MSKTHFFKRHQTVMHLESPTSVYNARRQDAHLRKDNNLRRASYDDDIEATKNRRIGESIKLKLDKELGVVSVQSEARSIPRAPAVNAIRQGRMRAPSSPVYLNDKALDKNNYTSKEDKRLNGMQLRLASRMLRLASKARTKILVSGVDKSLKVSSTIVAVRMRPPNSKEKKLDSRSVFSNTAQPAIESNTVCRVGKRAFTYDVVIGPRTSQGDVFKMTAKNVLHKVLSGFNGTVMAYGQTGSGKTYTMQGTSEQPGIIPRICANIFLAISEDKSLEYNVKCSYVEIYNETLHDLLTKEHTSPHIVEDPARGITLKNVIMCDVRSQVDVQDLFTRGAAQRAVGATEMNAQSSRSHAVFTIYVKSQSTGDIEGLSKKVSKFHLIDLAGSERADRTGASGSRLKEGAAINQSLSALGNVINALTKGTGRGKDSKKQAVQNRKKSHVPYRSSKLTRLLQDSLGGNSYTMLICNISPAKSSVAETLSSLRFAERAKQVQNNATINQDPKAVARLRLMDENVRLKKQVHSLLTQLREKGIEPNDVPSTSTITSEKHKHHASASIVETPTIPAKSESWRSGDVASSIHLAGANLELKKVKSEEEAYETKMKSIEVSRSRVLSLRKKAKERRQYLHEEQALLKKELDEIDAQASMLSLQEESLVKVKKFLSYVKDGNKSALDTADFPGGKILDQTRRNVAITTSSSPQRIHKDELRKQQYNRLHQQSMTNLHNSVETRQRARIEKAIEATEADSDGFVDFSDFVEELESIGSNEALEPESTSNSLNLQEPVTKGLSHRSPSTLNMERIQRDIDNSIGHHKIMVSNCTDMTNRSLNSVLDQLQSIESMLDGFDETFDEASEMDSVSISMIPKEMMPSKPDLDQAFVERLHSAIRWNRNTAKWGSLLDERDDSCNLADQKNGNTALHIAAQNGHIDVVKELLLRGANVNALNSSGNTPLHMAREYDYFWCCKCLIEANADVDIKNEAGHAANTGIEGEMSDKDGLPALSSAHNASEVDEALGMLEGQTDLDKAKLVMCALAFKKLNSQLWTDNVEKRFKAICNRL